VGTETKPLEAYGDQNTWTVVFKVRSSSSIHNVYVERRTFVLNLTWQNQEGLWIKLDRIVHPKSRTRQKTMALYQFLSKRATSHPAARAFTGLLEKCQDILQQTDRALTVRMMTRPGRSCATLADLLKPDLCRDLAEHFVYFGPLCSWCCIVILPQLVESCTFFVRLLRLAITFAYVCAIGKC
jgi:hypothetical protein